MRSTDDEQCPICIQNAHKAMREKYGEQPMEQFIIECDWYKNFLNHDSYTLEEETITSFQDGQLSLVYTAICDKCGFKIQIREKRKIEPPEGRYE